MIAMSYGTISRWDLVVGRNIPAMKITFLFEKAINADKETNSTLVRDEPETGIARLQDRRVLMRLILSPGSKPALRVLDCESNAFLCSKEVGVNLYVSESYGTALRLNSSKGWVNVRYMREHLPRKFGPHAFDVVLWRDYSLANNSQAHAENHELDACFQAIYEVLKPGGRLYVQITEQAKCARIEDTMAASLNARLVREQELHSILSSVGFGAFETIACEDSNIDNQPFLTLTRKPTLVQDKPRIDKLIQLLDLKRLKLAVLDCSFGVFYLSETNVNITVPKLPPRADIIRFNHWGVLR